ncbi:hypothetical protein TL16_g08307 [Triparma laevis f. inornata]|uniref:Myb-like domain-containing protein n=2 Tax=Triparma laevis TaxID=1534972 RepID=A0A9W7ACF4_9STRA|nr:hypothetical protein TrLO_g433 [Triparma laevis f. longispina]GMH79880.1 hypothetical protein TL16_g08307 [Triparma laevis f. inornata]
MTKELPRPLTLTFKMGVAATEKDEDFEETTATMSGMTRKGRGYVWTTEEDAAMMKVVGEHGLDFEQIKADNEALFANRTASAMEIHLVKKNPDKLKALRAATTRKPRPQDWTAEQDMAMVEDVEKFGFDFERIKAENEELLSNRNVNSIKTRYEKLEAQKYEVLKPKAVISRPKSFPEAAKEENPTTKRQGRSFSSSSSSSSSPPF